MAGAPAAAAVATSNAIDTDESAHMTEAALPEGFTWADARIASLRRGAIMAHLLQRADIALGACPLVLAHTRSAVVVGNPILALKATFIALLPFPIPLAHTCTAILFVNPMLTLALQTTCVAEFSGPMQFALAFRARIVGRAIMSTAETTCVAVQAFPSIFAPAFIAVQVWASSIHALSIQLALPTQLPLPFIPAGAVCSRAGADMKLAHPIARAFCHDLLIL
jgi:hypothetical protein